MRKHFRIIIILCLISSLARFVLDSYLPSLPAISQDLNISDAKTQLTLTLYLLGFSFSQLIYGPLSDYFGRRIIILVGLSIFVVGNLTCALAWSPELLLVGRFIAGVGAGACGVLNRAIASDCFKGADFSRAWSYTTTTLVIVLCVAPVLGGYIQEIWGWHANFMLGTLFVGSVLGIILKFLPETNLQKINPQTRKSSLSVRQVLRDYKIIFTTSSFITGALCYTLAFSGLIAYFQVSPLLFINHFGLSPSQYGWCSLVIASNYLIGGIIVNKFVNRFGIQYLLVFGTLLLILGGVSMLLAYTFNYVSISAILFPAAIYVIGARIVIPNAIASSMEQLRHLNGSCSALIGFIQMLGSSVISFLILRFSTTSAEPLAIFITVIGCMTLFVSLFIIKNKLKLGVDFIKTLRKDLTTELEKAYLLYLNNIHNISRITLASLWINFRSRFFSICKAILIFFIWLKGFEVLLNKALFITQS